MVPYDPYAKEEITLKDCLRLGKRVIVGYRHEKTQKHNSQIWPGVKVLNNHSNTSETAQASLLQTYWSPESKTVPKLHVYLNVSLNSGHSGKIHTFYTEDDDKKKNQFTASMAHISFGKTTILQQIVPFDVFGFWKHGIRAMTEKLDKELDHWYTPMCSCSTVHTYIF